MIKHIEEMIEKQKAYLKLEEMMLMNLDISQANNLIGNANK